MAKNKRETYEIATRDGKQPVSGYVHKCGLAVRCLARSRWTIDHLASGCLVTPYYISSKDKSWQAVCELADVTDWHADSQTISRNLDVVNRVKIILGKYDNR